MWCTADGVISFAVLGASINDVVKIRKTEPILFYFTNRVEYHTYSSWLKDIVDKVICFSDKGGFQLEFLTKSRVINHMTCYNSSALIGWNYNIQTGEQIL